MSTEEYTQDKNSTVVLEIARWSYAMQLLLLALKLTGNITWRWLWVLTPMWYIPALMLTSLVIAIPISLIAYLLGNHEGKKDDG